MSEAVHTRGRGLVISGALLIALNLIVTIVVAAYLRFFDALVAMGVDTGLGPALIPIGLAVDIASWFVGVPSSRSDARGSVDP